MSTDEFTLYDAAYVLGALSPADRRGFENHLRSCAACASSVGELAGLPGLMSKVSEEQLTAEVEAPPETLLPALARAVRRERGRRRLTVGAAAVAAACLIAVGAVIVTGPDSPTGPVVAAPSSTPSGNANLVLKAVAPSPISGHTQLVGMDWGTRIDLTCWPNVKGQPPTDGSYALFVIDRSGAAQQVATWKAVPDGRVTLMGTTSVARQNIEVVEVRTMSGRAILRQWP
jgi:hypothetical protein